MIKYYFQTQIEIDSVHPMGEAGGPNRRNEGHLYIEKDSLRAAWKELKKDMMGWPLHFRTAILFTGNYDIEYPNPYPQDRYWSEVLYKDLLEDIKEFNSETLMLRLLTRGP